MRPGELNQFFRSPKQFLEGVFNTYMEEKEDTDASDEERSEKYQEMILMLAGKHKDEQFSKDLKEIYDEKVYQLLVGYAKTEMGSEWTIEARKKIEKAVGMKMREEQEKMLEEIKKEIELPSYAQLHEIAKKVGILPEQVANWYTGVEDPIGILEMDAHMVQIPHELNMEIVQHFKHWAQKIKRLEEQEKEHKKAIDKERANAKKYREMFEGSEEDVKCMEDQVEVLQMKLMEKDEEIQKMKSLVEGKIGKDVMDQLQEKNGQLKDVQQMYQNQISETSEVRDRLRETRNKLAREEQRSKNLQMELANKRKTHEKSQAEIQKWKSQSEKLEQQLTNSKFLNIFLENTNKKLTRENQKMEALEQDKKDFMNNKTKFMHSEKKREELVKQVKNLELGLERSKTKFYNSEKSRKKLEENIKNLVLENKRYEAFKISEPILQKRCQLVEDYFKTHKISQETISKLVTENESYKCSVNRKFEKLKGVLEDFLGEKEIEYLMKELDSDGREEQKNEVKLRMEEEKENLCK